MSDWANCPGEPNMAHWGRSYLGLLRCQDCGEEWEAEVTEEWGGAWAAGDGCPMCDSGEYEIVGEATDEDPRDTREEARGER